VKPIRLHTHQCTISRLSCGPFPRRSRAIRNASAHPSSFIYMWLSLLAILVGNLALISAAGSGIWYDWANTLAWDHCSDALLQPHAPQTHQPREGLFAAMQPGRLGVTEQPGRRGVADHDGRPNADLGQPAREPIPSGDRPRPIIVEALLNRQVSVPLMLDTGATYTVLTRQTASDIGITSLARLPKHSFLTPGGPISSPITTLKSIRVGTVEAQNVAVAIDAEGHLPLGLLGMTFMRHFKVTVDQAQGQVKFERR
jgi:clan AA aspartic protease (TIGR02281 family)